MPETLPPYFVQKISSKQSCQSVTIYLTGLIKVAQGQSLSVILGETDRRNPIKISYPPNKPVNERKRDLENETEGKRNTKRKHD